MSIATVIEIAIGVLSVWIVLSFITVLIQPLISKGLRKEATDLELAIQRILGHELLIDQFYNHPIILSLTADKGKLPSRIPAQQFALAIFDIAFTAGTESSLIQMGILKIRDDLEKSKKSRVYEPVIDELNLLAEFARSAAATEAGTAITKRSLESLRNQVLQFIENLMLKYPRLKLDHEVAAMLADGLKMAILQATRIKAEIDMNLEMQHSAIKGDSAINKLRRSVIAISVFNPRLSQTLNALLLNVEDYVTPRETSLGRAKKNVEKWFEDSIATKSNDLKRHSQSLALIIGLVLALVFNIDSINMAIYFWGDASLREALVQNSANFVSSEQDPNALQDFSKQLVNLNLPIGWMISKPGTSTYDGSQCRLFPATTQAFGIRISSNSCLAPPQSHTQTNIILKLMGIFITALAARQGAPYWFDLLKGLLSIRGAVAKPATSE